MLIRNFISLGCAALTAVFMTVSCSEKEPGTETPAPQNKVFITAQPASVSLSSDEPSFEILIKFDGTYNIEVSAEWIKKDGDEPVKQDAGGDTWRFNAEPNPTMTARSGQIKISSAKDRFIYTTVDVEQKGNAFNVATIKPMVDPDATEETKALYTNLWAVADYGFMFGHHDDLWYGRYWYNESGRSDTKEVCGDYPAVFSVDFGSIMHSNWHDGENDIRRRVILEARERGEVIMAVCHLDNPKTQGQGGYPTGTSWDSTKCVDQILVEGSDLNRKFKTWLDRAADFALNLKDKDGKLIPIIFRPFHEHTQYWSWWQCGATSESEFISLWRMTVEYLRDTKGVHNFIYAISPQMDYTYDNAKARLLTRWPGDNYVDFLGMDCYHGNGTEAFKNNLKAIAEVSREKKMPCGVTENGHEAFTYSDYWTRNILAPMTAERVSLVVMWRNKYVGSNEGDTHFFSVYPGHPSEDNFIQMYNNPKSLFSDDLPDMYSMAPGITIGSDDIN